MPWLAPVVAPTFEFSPHSPLECRMRKDKSEYAASYRDDQWSREPPTIEEMTRVGSPAVATGKRICDSSRVIVGVLPWIGTQWSSGR